MMKITAVQIDPPKLHKTIVTHFSLDEIRDLCFDLGLDFDELSPGGKSAKARGLVEMCQRQRRLVKLAEAVFEHRPNIKPNEFLRDIANDDAPFKGLLAFEEADEEIFFGREALTAELVARVHGPEPTNFLAIVGASGSGKSSVVRAGMIPHLRRQTKWPIHLITPTAHPLQALATSLTRDSESVMVTATLMDDLQKESRALRLYAGRLLQNGQTKRLLLVVDQFEELFTLCKDEAERTAFVENLVEAIRQDNQITILLTLRADFYHHCLQYKALHNLLEQQQKIVPPMSSAELRAAIELPARQANLTFEGGLVDILLRDVGAADNQTPEPGALPLLSHALLETWQRRVPNENRLTLIGYTEAGGVQGAIAKTAESTYQRLPKAQQKIARSIFLRLTELGEGTQDTRRRADLTELLPQDDERTTVEQVLKTLADARLLTTSEDGAEVAHEALIRQWPTLQSWLDEDREGLRLHRQLTEAAQAWADNECEESYLFRGGRLGQTVEWAAKSDAQLNQLETEFLAASQKLEADELAKAQAVAAERTRASRFLRIALFVADSFAIGFLIFLLQSQINARNLVRQSQVALAQSTAALANVVLERDNDTELATLLTIESAWLNWKGNGNIDWLIDSNLRSYLAKQRFFNNSLKDTNLGVSSVVFSPDGERLASVGADGTTRLWDMTDASTEPVALPKHESRVNSVAFSPDGDRLATGSADGTIRLWDVADPSSRPVVLTRLDSIIGSVTFSPDGSWLASGSIDRLSQEGTIRLWNVADPNAEPVVLAMLDSIVLSMVFSPDGNKFTSVIGDGTIRLWDMDDPGAEPIVLMRHEFRSVAFSPDGNRLASGSEDGTIRLWDMTAPSAEPVVLTGLGGGTSSLAFSPDGSWLASGSYDGRIRLWNLADTSMEPVILTGHGEIVRSVAFSPDGSRLASGSSDSLSREGTIRLWDMADPSAEPMVLPRHDSFVLSVVFSPDGNMLSSVSDDGTIRLWDMADASIESLELTRYEERIPSVAFSPDGSWLASGSDDGTIRLWDLTDPSAEPVVLARHDSIVLSVAFSPDGSRLASGSYDGRIRLWSMAELSAEPVVLPRHESSIRSVTFSLDGTRLASGTDAGSIWLWNMADPSTEPVVLTGHRMSVSSLAFSPDGSRLASGSGGSDVSLWQDGTIRLWDMDNLSSEPVVLTGLGGRASSLAFSPDGSQLASGNADGTIRLWNLDAPSAEAVVLTGHEARASSLAFSPDGSWLASGSADGTIWVWPTLDELVEIGCQKVRRNLSWDEWQRYLLGEPYRQTCPNLPPHPSVPAEELGS